MLFIDGVEVLPPPEDLKEHHSAVFTLDAVHLLARCSRHFRQRVRELYAERTGRRLQVASSEDLPTVKLHQHGDDWVVDPVPDGLKDRRLDLGDVSPADVKELTAALNSSASGVQVDFDDGHCPTWRRQLLGWYHVSQVCRGELDIPPLGKAPVLMLRPRAWNMTEYNILVDGAPVPGALADFSLLMFHCGKALAEAGRGPALYLPKLESTGEARLWDDMFTWAERELDMQLGTIRGCLMIENVLAMLEIEDMLYALRHHSLGLNTGVWDYTASFISIFSHRADVVFPDRAHITMSAPCLSECVRHAVNIARRRGAPVTSGMAPHVLPEDPEARAATVAAVCAAKRRDIASGVDGFLAYDVGLVSPLLHLWQEDIPRDLHPPDLSQLLAIPSGDITLSGLRHSIRVSLLFISSWLRGSGKFLLDGKVEDSATAEIARSQLWQWLRHNTRLSDVGETVTLSLLRKEMTLICEQLEDEGRGVSQAVPLLFSITRSKEFVPFITTYLSEQPVILDAE